jgi:type II secretory pathway component PulJ
VSDGYTIIEVMIFLAISVALMASAMNLIKGKQAETEFSQKARDAQSKLQSWINNVSTGFTGADPSQDHCKISGLPEVVTNTSDPAPVGGYTPECVYLGEAIQLVDSGSNNNTIYAYSVFGTRLNGGVEPKNLKTSNPEAAAGQGGSVDLTQSLDLTPLHVSSTTSHLVGFYNSINTESSTSAGNGQSDVNAYEYAFSGSPSTPADQGNTALIQCIELTGPCNTADYPPKLSRLDVCLSDGKRTAQLSVISSSGLGADVTLTYKNC